MSYISPVPFYLNEQPAYLLYRMKFGTLNPQLTRAINLLSRTSANVRFVRHAQDMMERRAIDHADVLTCLQHGKAYGPELQKGQLRANVIHRGVKVRASVGGLDCVEGNWSSLLSVTVITVMECD